MNPEKLAEFVHLIRNSHRAVFFGGAGVSTESGVKDYRSEDGLYNTVKEYGVSPETILSHSFFLQNTPVFYDFYDKYFLSETALPNKAHKALAELEKKGILSAVITQNIDGLHQAAGSQNVLELHGTAAHHYCMKCGREFPLEELRELHGGVPYCTCGGLVKPKVVLDVGVYTSPLPNCIATSLDMSMPSFLYAMFSWFPFVIHNILSLIGENSSTPFLICPIILNSLASISPILLRLALSNISPFNIQ